MKIHSLFKRRHPDQGEAAWRDLFIIARRSIDSLRYARDDDSSKNFMKSCTV